MLGPTFSELKQKLGMGMGLELSKVLDLDLAQSE